MSIFESIVDYAQEIGKNGDDYAVYRDFITVAESNTESCEFYPDADGMLKGRLFFKSDSEPFGISLDIALEHGDVVFLSTAFVVYPGKREIDKDTAMKRIYGDRLLRLKNEADTYIETVRHADKAEFDKFTCMLNRAVSMESVVAMKLFMDCIKTERVLASI